MKPSKQKNYSIIIASNTASPAIKFNLSQKSLRFILAGFGMAIFSLVLFLSDYFALNVDQWKLNSLAKENKELKNTFHIVETKLADLENEMQQLSDFSRKIKLITTNSIHQGSSQNQLGYGKISGPTILALSKPSPDRQISSTDTQQMVQKQNAQQEVKSLDIYESDLEVRIEKLTQNSQLVQQDTWKVYTDLLEQSNFINNTPSISPAKGWISSSYGYRNEVVFVDHQPKFHRGLDIASRIGEPVVVTADGKVVFTGYDEFGYGNVIIVDHGFGLKTYYAHLAKIKTQIGTYLKRGDVIGAIGNTGKSTGPHLHYEVRIHGKPVNPENYILDDHHHNL